MTSTAAKRLERGTCAPLPRHFPLKVRQVFFQVADSQSNPGSQMSSNIFYSCICPVLFITAPSPQHKSQRVPYAFRKAKGSNEQKLYQAKLRVSGRSRPEHTPCGRESRQGGTQLSTQLPGSKSGWLGGGHASDIIDNDFHLDLRVKQSSGIQNPHCWQILSKQHQHLVVWVAINQGSQ